jgi:hypothetical protein
MMTHAQNLLVMLGGRVLPWFVGARAEGPLARRETARALRFVFARHSVGSCRLQTPTAAGRSRGVSGSAVDSRATGLQL